jgi:hypothetical protein
MATKISDLFTSIPSDGDDLVEWSDKIWELGKIAEIEEAVSSELFTVHIGMNVIGIWQGDGWYGIIRDHSELIPYIPNALDNLGLQKIKKAFQEVIVLFPKFTDYNDSKSFSAVYNFVVNTRLPINDERLKQYSKEERSLLSNKFHELMEILDSISGATWGYDTSQEGWDSVIKYIKLHI